MDSLPHTIGMAVAKKPPGRFHHGDLARALLDALAEAIAEHGPEAISLRDVARRAGVAHSAAAPHFGDKRGLLTAFAAEGLERLGAAQRAFMARADPAPAAQCAAAGHGYLDFARRHPAHFRIMFRKALLAGDDARLVAAAEQAWRPLAETVAALLPGACGIARQHAMAHAWSTVHGFASLEAEGASRPLRGDLPLADAEDALIAGLVAALSHRQE